MLGVYFATCGTLQYLTTCLSISRLFPLNRPAILMRAVGVGVAPLGLYGASVGCLFDWRVRRWVRDHLPEIITSEGGS